MKRKKVEMMIQQNQMNMMYQMLSKNLMRQQNEDVNPNDLAGLDYQEELRRQQNLNDIQEDDKLSYIYGKYLDLEKRYEKLNHKLERSCRQAARAKEDAHSSKERCKDLEKKAAKMEKEFDKLQRKISTLEKIADRAERIITGRDTKVSSKVVLRRMKDFERGTRKPMLPMKEHEKYIEARYVGEGRYE